MRALEAIRAYGAHDERRDLDMGARPASFHRRHFDALEEGALLVVDLLPPGGGVRLSDAHDVRALPDKQHHRHREERHHSSTEDVIQQWVDGIR
ncbi:hypothetical protein MRX96_042119 [Rhipicephalus microplus]